MSLQARVVSRGTQGGQASLNKISAHVGGAAPLKVLHWLGISEFIGLASKCYDQLLRQFLLLIILYQY